MRYRVLDLQQNTQEWLDFRRDKISASRAGVILGVSPYQTPLELYEEIVCNKKQPENEAMRKGKEKEVEGLNWLNTTYNFRFEPTVVQSIANPFFIASLDGFWVDPEGCVHAAELKLNNKEVHETIFLSEKIPDHHWAQCNHIMDLLGIDHMRYISFPYGKGKPLVIYLERDEEYCKMLFQEEMIFLAKLLKKEPPEPCERDWKVYTNPMLEAEAHRYRSLDLMIKEMEEEKEAIRKALIQELDHPRAMVASLKFQKATRAGNVDYKAIPELQGVELDKYRKPSTEYWTVTCQ